MKTESSLLIAWLLLATVGTSLGQPSITTQPKDQSVSLGATVAFSVRARTLSPPLACQWWFQESPIDVLGNTTATTYSLTITNVALAQAGNYWAVVSDTTGSVTSRVAQLIVDPTFTKITEGPVVTDTERSYDMSWWDYDNDGYLDLFVANGYVPPFNSMYHNNGDETFTKITTNAIVTTQGSFILGAMGDYNNDGNLDLFVVNYSTSCCLFRNDGGGKFTKLTSAECGPIVSDNFQSFEGAWADYDRDGFIDLFTPNGIMGSFNDCLYRNNGDGTFTRMTTNEVGALVNDHAQSGLCSWADYDNDGYPDLWVGRQGGSSSLHHNEGNGTFRKITEGSVTGNNNGLAGVWGDYDNDGFLDLVVLNAAVGGPCTIWLHHNLGGVTFTNVAQSAGLVPVFHGHIAAWGDYDNDGFLDLFVIEQNNRLERDWGDDLPVSRLYHNNHDGTFASVDVGSPNHDGINKAVVAWADYDNDGFLDLSMGCGEAGAAMKNLLYRNNGNSNRWLKVKLVGAVSNRGGIGAKIRVKATITGKSFWQMREISGNSAHAAGQGLIAHFGLGDAQTVETLRIEWPSGIVQEFQGIKANLFLTMTEPSALAALGAGQLQVRCWKGMSFEVEASTDLVHWSPVGTVTNMSGSLTYGDPDARTHGRRFYRVKGQ